MYGLSSCQSDASFASADRTTCAASAVGGAGRGEGRTRRRTGAGKALRSTAPRFPFVSASLGGVCRADGRGVGIRRGVLDRCAAADERAPGCDDAVEGEFLGLHPRKTPFF